METLSESILAAINDTTFSSSPTSTNFHQNLSSAEKPIDEIHFPLSIIDCYRRLSITKLFSWQADCLDKALKNEKRNFLFSAPASAGKTMVAELLMVKSIVETKRKVIFVEPFVSIVQEKAKYFRNLFSPIDLRVSTFVGGTEKFPSLTENDLIICTIEKANSLINRIIFESETLSSLGTIVVDEIHWIAEKNRGFLIEILLSKIRFFDEKKSVRIIGMSATIPNLNQIAEWIDAETFQTNFRPVPLNEFVKVDSTFYDRQFSAIRSFNFNERWNQGDNESVTEIVWNVIERSGQNVLIFVSTKHWCEVLAKLLVKNFRTIIQDKQIDPFDYEQLQDVVEQLRRTPAGLDTDLGVVVPFGVGFHHGGLTLEEREIIENAYRSNIIRVIVCTSTLSSGVNLPARLVVIRSPLQNGRCIEMKNYLQMIGRAGRKGFDEFAESVLICSRKEVELVQKMFEQEEKNFVESCLVVGDDFSNLKRVLLELIGSDRSNRIEQIEKFVETTFLNFSKKKIFIENSLKNLLENDLIRSTDGVRFEVTSVGRAVIDSSISPDDGAKIVVEMSKAQRKICLENDLHLIFLIIPQQIVETTIGSLDWNVFHGVWPTDVVDQHVAHLIGINSIVVYKKAAAFKLEKREFEEKFDAPRYARFFLSLILKDLLEEKSIAEVMNKFQCNKTFLQQLQQAASNFVSVLQIFADRLSWNNLKNLFSNFQFRLQFAIRQELCDLIRIPILNGCRARQLYNDGFTTLAALANGDERKIERSLQKSVPFQTAAQKLEDEKQGQIYRDGNFIFVSGREPLTNRRAAKEIVEEAKKLIEEDFRSAGLNFSFRRDESMKTNFSSNSSDENFFEKTRKIRENFFPSLFDDKNLRVRNAYVDESRISSDFILLIENKETVAISCATRKIPKNSFENEIKLEFVACAFSVHKIFLINVEQDEIYFQKNRISALIHVREKLFNKKHNIVVFDGPQTLFTLLSYLSISRIFARLIDLQLCFWLKQDAIDEEQIDLWTEKHRNFVDFQIDRGEKDFSICEKVSLKVLLFAAIVPIVEKQMKERNIWNYYLNVEMPALLVSIQILLNGFLVDQNELNRNRKFLENLSNQLEFQAYRLAQRRFRLNQRSDLINILHVQLKFPVERKANGRISLSKTLKKLEGRHPLVNLLIEYRKIEEALTACVEPLEKFLKEPRKVSSLQRLRREAPWQNERFYGRTHFLTTNGRLANIDPPLEKISKSFQIENLGEKSTIHLGKMIVARNGFRLFSFEFCQLEIRIAAHLSEDSTLKSMFGTPIEKVFYDFVFGKSIENETNLDFVKKFSALKNFLDQIEKTFSETGQIRSFLGRSFEISEKIKTNRKKFRFRPIEFFLRASAGDFVKMTMDRVVQQLDRSFPFDFKARRIGVRAFYFIFQRENEFIFEIEIGDRTKEIVETIRQSMENQNLISTVFPVRVQFGPDLSSMENFEI